jgi:hypothetical protein
LLLPVAVKAMRDATHSLLIDWAALMALSLILAFAGDVVGLSRPGAAWLVVIASVAAIKARIILRSYLGLARAPAAATGFFAVVFIVLALVAVSFLIFPTPPRFGAASAQTFARTFAGGIE